MRRAVPVPRQPGAHASPWLSDAGEARLRARLARARRQAHPDTPILVSVTERLAGAHDPAAIVLGSRRADESWFCLEQPARDAHGARGAGRGARASSRPAGDGSPSSSAAGRRSAERAVDDAADAPPGAGLVAVAGFAFADDGAGSPAWRGFGAASLTVPAIWFARRAETTWITCNVAVTPDDDAELLLDGLRQRLSRLRRASAAAARSRADRSVHGAQPDAARPLRGGGGARGRAHPKR